MIKSVLPLCLFFAFAFTSHLAWSAEEPKDDKAKQLPIFGVHMGTLLPDQIEDVTEILPMWGLRYGFPRKNSMIEVGAMSAQSMGVNFYNAHVSLRGTVPFEGLSGIIYIGADASYYKGPSLSGYRLIGGGHVGGGIEAPLGEYMNFRGEMKFNANPGISLYIGFGLEFLLPPSGDNKEEPK